MKLFGNRALTSSVGFAGILLVTFVSPLALVLVGKLLRLDWTTVTAIGQSYTGISAILAALALIGVVYSINLQNRQVNIARSQAVRAMQFDLLRFAMNDTEYAAVIRPHQLGDHSYDQYKVDVYRTQWLRYLQFSYLAGEIAPDALRATLQNNLFHLAGTRMWWIKIKPIWRSESLNAPKECHKFLDIVEEAYSEAAAANLETSLPQV